MIFQIFSKSVSFMEQFYSIFHLSSILLFLFSPIYPGINHVQVYLINVSDEQILLHDCALFFHKESLDDRLHVLVAYRVVDKTLCRNLQKNVFR